ncbi:hypothetical protein D3C84_208800 [compost metagenome]
MHLVGIAYLGPGFLAYRGYGFGVQGAELVAGCRVAPAPVLHRLGAAFLQRRVVEEGIGPGVEDFRGQWRGRRQVAGEQFDLAGLHAPQQGQPGLAVHGLVQAVVEGLRHQRVVGDLAFADDVLQAGHLVGEHRGQQVFAAHALQLRRHLASAGEARQGQGDAGVPAPAHGEQRRIQHGLDQQLLGAVGVQVAPHLVQREAVAGRQREDQRVLGGGGLQLEVEAAAEALAQGQAPGAVEAAAEGRMDDQLHAAGFVEEALHHQPPLGRQAAEGGAGAGQVVDDLQRRGFAEADALHQPGAGVVYRAWCGGGRIFADKSPPTRAGTALPCGRGLGRDGLDAGLIANQFAATAQQSLDLLAQARHRGRQLVAAPRRLAEPKGDGRRLAAGVLDPHLARLDAQDAVGLVAQLEDIAGHALDGEVLVEGADRQALGFQQHAVVARVGNGAAAGQGGQAGAAAAAQALVDRIAVQVGGAHAAAAAVAFGEHLQQGVEAFARQADVGRGAGQQPVQAVLAPLAAGHLGDYLLGQHVQRRAGDLQCIQLAAPYAVEQGGAFDQLVARLREQPALGRAADAVAGAADPLQQGGDAARRAELADQLDLADVDAQLQRGGGHQHPQLAALEALLGVQAQLLGQAAVVGGDRGAAEAFGQVAAGALGQAPGVDEHQGGAVLPRQFGQTVVDAVPDLVAHHRFQRHRRDFDGQVAGTAVADVDDMAGT